MIRNLEVPNRYFLSPMVEPNDIAFRLLCKKAGAGLTYTGLFSPLSLKPLVLDDRPALQLFGSTNKGFRAFMKKYDDQVSLWDFNLGCPSKLSRKLGHGACMHKDFENIEKILRTMRRNTKKPISLKLRKSPQALAIAKLAEKYCDIIAIHPRTLDQGYAGEPDYDFALKVRDSVKIPVIYSGNVNLDNVDKVLKDFPFVMIGRASLGNPAIFAKLTGVEYKNDFLEYLSLAEQYGLFFRQMKYHAMQFTKGHPRAKMIRHALISAKTIDDLRRIWQNT